MHCSTNFTNSCYPPVPSPVLFFHAHLARVPPTSKPTHVYLGIQEAESTTSQFRRSINQSKNQSISGNRARTHTCADLYPCSTLRLESPAMTLLSLELGLLQQLLTLPFLVAPPPQIHLLLDCRIPREKHFGRKFVHRQTIPNPPCSCYYYCCCCCLIPNPQTPPVACDE
jgi:hypothetical protein